MRAAPGWAHAVVYTVGHSTRPLEQLVMMLESVEVQVLADIRTVPRSRTNPQFNATSLCIELPTHGITYAHLANLGGLRRPVPGRTENAAWRNESFRGYADYMQTAHFRDGLRELKLLAERGPVAVMCAEANPWRCHRHLVADALLAHGAEVRELRMPGKWAQARLTPFAQVKGREVTYPSLE